MDYFHRRNLPQTEYSGHEAISVPLLNRLIVIWNEYVGGTTPSYRVTKSRMQHEAGLQFPGWTIERLFEEAHYGKIFTLVEILSTLSHNMGDNRSRSLRYDLSEAFRLSGCVYQLKNSRVELVIAEDLAKKLTTVQDILSPFEKSYQTFFNAVGDLVGRRKPPKDVIKDLFVGAEGYLKADTGENDFGDSTKSLLKKGVLNPIQKSIMDKLYGYRSDADGVAHSGNTNTPGEIDALWFLETTLAQITLVHRKTGAGKP